MTRKEEFLVSAVLCAFGIFVLLWSSTIPLMVAVEKGSVVNARFFPKLMSSLLILLSIVMALEAHLKRYSQTAEEGVESDSKVSQREKWYRWTSLAIICLVFYFLFQPLGFLLSSFLFMLAFLIFLGTRKWYALVILSSLVPLCIYILFKIILGAPLPDGLLFF